MGGEDDCNKTHFKETAMLADKLIPHIDTVLRTLFAPAATSRPYPDAGLEEGE